MLSCGDKERLTVIDEKIIAHLLKIGQHATSDSHGGEGHFAAIAESDYINRMHWSEWDQVTAAMTTADIVYLVKGLTIAEAHCRWSGGSVASAIWVFRELVRRGDAELLSTLARWVYLHRSNSYLPFGSTRYWSYEDYLHRTSPACLAEKQRVYEGNEQLKLARKEARIQKRAEAERIRKEISIQRSDRRNLMLEELSQMTTCDRWHHIATDKTVTPDFYPEEWAEVSDSDLQLLPLSTLELLVDRLGVKCSGSWRELRKRVARLNHA